MVLRVAVAFALALMFVGMAQAAPAPKIPANELPGRERERFLDGPVPSVPRIELQDGHPKAVIRAPDETRPAKRQKRRAGKLRRG